MFRLYEIYSLYKKKMSSYGTSPPWCLCEKLPRSILHVHTPRPQQWCEICGRPRRPLACLSSSSDEEIAKQPPMQPQDSVEAKVAVLAMKQKAKDRNNCLNCDGKAKPTVPRAVVHPQHHRHLPRLPLHQHRQPLQQPPQLSPRAKHTSTASNNANKTYIGRFGHYRKPVRLPQRRQREEDPAVKLKKQQNNGPESVAPPPPPPSSPATPAGISGLTFESLWEKPNEDMPHLVAFAHEVFNRPLNPKSTLPSFYDNLFVSDFIPLDKPITDSAGGAISKQQRHYGNPARLHCSRPLPPLSQIQAAVVNPRAKGGGLVQKPNETHCNDVASQFSPFDFYEGPSEDALAVDSARLVLRQTNALHIKQRADLPPTRLASFESEPSSDCSSLFEAPSAPPPGRQQINNSKGAPFRMHELMKAVAKSDSSASSSSTSSSLSPKSVSSILPVQQQSVRSRGGEQPSFFEEKLTERRRLPLSIIEKILLLLEKPTADSSLPSPSPDDPLQKSENMDKSEHKQPTEALNIMEFMGNLLITDEDDTADSDENRSAVIKNEEKLTVLEEALPESETSNDMSNELPLNSSNKSAADEKYENGFSNADQKCKQHCRQRGGLIKRGLIRSSSSSMWSTLGGFFTARLARDKETSSLKDSERLEYRAINEPTKGKPNDNRPKPNASNQCCQKCGLNRKKQEPLRTNMIHMKQSFRNSMPKPCLAVQTDPYLLTVAVTKQTTNIKEDKSEQTKTKKPNADLLATPRPNAQSDLPNATPATGCTTFVSCIRAVSSVTLVAEPTKFQPSQEVRNQLPKYLLQKMKDEQQQTKPVVYYGIKNTSTVYYASSEIIKPKMLACSSPIIGRMQQYTLSIPTAQTACTGIYEFRMPDIQAKELEKRKHHFISEKIELETTPFTLSESSQSPNELAAKRNRCYLPAWPVHPKLVRRRLIKYPPKQLELDSIHSKENSTKHRSESNESKDKEQFKTKRRWRKKDEMWIVNEKVHRKINEMMTKPLKLLTMNASQAAQT